MKRQGRKISFIAILVLLLSAIFASGASATNSPSWHWEYTPEGDSYVVDNRCDGDYSFRVVVFRNANFAGDKAVLCGYWDNLEQIPTFNHPFATWWSDQISSLKVTYVRPGRCVMFHRDRDQEGPNIGYTGWASYVGDARNDTFTSVRLGC